MIEASYPRRNPDGSITIWKSRSVGPSMAHMHVPTPGVDSSTAARGPLEDMAAAIEEADRRRAKPYRTLLTPAEYQMLARYECDMLRKRESLKAPAGLNRRDRRAWLKRNKGSHG